MTSLNERLNFIGTPILLTPSSGMNSGTGEAASRLQPDKDAASGVRKPGVPRVLRGQRSVHQLPRFLSQRRQLARQAAALRLVL